MMEFDLRCSLLLLLALGLLVQGERISQTKCSEFRNKIVTTNRSLCPTASLILTGITPGEHAHYAAIGWSNTNEPGKFEFLCGGSLISERFVLTAAHCMRAGVPEVVRLGVHRLLEYESIRVDVGIESVVKHPEHKFRYAYHDIALIKLKNAVEFSATIRPACLWMGSITNALVSTTGFDLNGYRTYEMQNGQVDILDHGICEEAFKNYRALPQGIDPAQLCVSSADGKDCFQDPGSPLQVLEKPSQGCMYHIVGLVPRFSCETTGKFANLSIYTNVTNYIDWIEGVVWG